VKKVQLKEKLELKREKFFEREYSYFKTNDTKSHFSFIFNKTTEPNGSL
jgi:hypothetical protein